MKKSHVLVALGAFGVGLGGTIIAYDFYEAAQKAAPRPFVFAAGFDDYVCLQSGKFARIDINMRSAESLSPYQRNQTGDILRDKLGFFTTMSMVAEDSSKENTDREGSALANQLSREVKKQLNIDVTFAAQIELTPQGTACPAPGYAILPKPPRP